MSNSELVSLSLNESPPPLNSCMFRAGLHWGARGCLCPLSGLGSQLRTACILGISSTPEAQPWLWVRLLTVSFLLARSIKSIGSTDSVSLTILGYVLFPHCHYHIHVLSPACITKLAKAFSLQFSKPPGTFLSSVGFHFSALKLWVPFWFRQGPRSHHLSISGS